MSSNDCSALAKIEIVSVQDYPHQIIFITFLLHVSVTDLKVFS